MKKDMSNTNFFEVPSLGDRIGKAIQSYNSFASRANSDTKLSTHVNKLLETASLVRSLHNKAKREAKEMFWNQLTQEEKDNYLNLAYELRG